MRDTNPVKALKDFSSVGGFSIMPVRSTGGLASGRSCTLGAGRMVNGCNVYHHRPHDESEWRGSLREGFDWFAFYRKTGSTVTLEDDLVTGANPTYSYEYYSC